MLQQTYVDVCVLTRVDVCVLTRVSLVHACDDLAKDIFVTNLTVYINCMLLKIKNYLQNPKYCFNISCMNMILLTDRHLKLGWLLCFISFSLKIPVR